MTPSAKPEVHIGHRTVVREDKATCNVYIDTNVSTFYGIADDNGAKLSGPFHYSLKLSFI